MIKAVTFDAFGTICRIAKKSNPYGKLFRQMGVDFASSLRQALTKPLSLEELAALLAGGKIDAGTAAALPGIASDLACELGSVEAFPETIEVLKKLRAQGYRIAVLSNLALPYGTPVKQLFGEFVDLFVFSFEVDAAKPDAAVYKHLAESLALPPSEILMVGDSRKNDYDGPLSFGMQALHLNRNGGKTEFPTIVDLGSVPEYLQSSK